MSKPDGEIIAVVADLHVNDTVALAPPRVPLDDGGYYQPSVPQEALWEAWVDAWSYVAKRKKKRGWPVRVLALGDLGDLNSHEQVQLITVHRPTIERAMTDVFEPVIPVADSLFIIRGTAAHVGGSGELDEWLAGDLDKVVRPGTGNQASWWNLQATFGGVDFDAAHHPPVSSTRPDTKNAAAGRAAGIVALRYLERRKTPPQVCIWGHLHVRAQGTAFGVWGYFCPSWKLVGGYGYRKGSGACPEPVGLWLFECRNGEVDADSLCYWPKEEPRWTAS